MGLVIACICIALVSAVILIIVEKVQEFIQREDHHE